MEAKTIKIYDAGQLGEVQITEDVISVIAGLAATEVEGVDSMAGGITNEIVSKLGKKNLSAGVNVAIEDDCVSIILALVVKMGYVIPDVSAIVQDRVKSSVENMTGLKVSKVDIRIANIKVDR